MAPSVMNGPFFTNSLSSVDSRTEHLLQMKSMCEEVARRELTWMTDISLALIKGVLVCYFFIAKYYGGVNAVLLLM